MSWITLPFNPRYRVKTGLRPESPLLTGVWASSKVGVRENTHDHGSCPSRKTIRARVLSGVVFGQGHRPPGEIRGPRLRGRVAQGAPEGQARRPGTGQLGDAGKANRGERGRLPAAGDPPEDRRAHHLLPGVQGGRHPAGNPGGGHHHLGEALHLHPDGEPPRPRAAPDPRGARGAPRPRRPAPALGAPRPDPGRRGPGDRGPGGALRHAGRPADRGALRHDQRQAHAAQPLPYREPRRTQALSGPQPGAGSRRHPLAERGRDVPASRRHQDARHRAGEGLPGPARRGDGGLPGDGGKRRRQRPDL